MPQEQDNLYQLWSSVSKEYELPDFETFKADMQDTSNRRGFYESVSADYELPDYDTFQKDMGFEAPVAEKKKTTQEVGAGFGPLLPGTPSTGGFKLAEPTATPAKEKPAAKKPSKELDLKDFNQWQADLKAGKITRDAYAEQQKQANDDAYIRYKQDVENKSVEFYSQNADKFSEDPVYGYMEYLKVNNPSKYTEIQERKSAGGWDKGADPVVKAQLEQIGAGIGIPLAAGYEAVAEILGDANAEDSAKLYNEAVSFKGQTESAIIRKLSKTPAIKEYNALQNDLQNNPIDKEVREIQSSVDALMQYDAGRLQGELKEYEELQRKGAANNNRLDPKDYERYQSIKQSPEIAEYEKLMQKQQQVLATPAGKEYAAKMQQVQQMQSAPEVRNLLSVYQKVYENAAETKSQSEAYVKKFPQQAFGEAYEKTKQEKVDAFYKRMNPVLKAFVDAGTNILRVPYTLAGEIGAGYTRVLAAIPEILGAEGQAIILNDAADVISNVSEGLNANLFPQPTNLQVATYDNYIPYYGFRVYTNQRNEVIDIRDDDGYALPEDVAAGVAMRFDNEAVKPDKVNAMNYHMILPKLTQTAADLIVLSQVPVAGAEFGLGHAASMAAYGYLTNYDNAYEEIKAADPFISEEAAHLYANTKGMMMGGMLTLTPQSIFGNQGNKIWKEIGSEYTKILAGGTTSKLALTSAMAKIMSKEGAAMAGIGFAMDLGDRAVKMAANTLTDRPTQETEYKLNQAVETGVSMFVVGGIMAGFSKGWGKGLRGDALYTGLKNYERTIGEMEQMANRGDISQQDFNRATNILSQLKPIYDNLADMGKYNDAYKANLIGLYAEKLKIEEKLGKITNIEALQKGASPERDALVAQLNQIDAKIESLAVIHNPEFVVYTESAKVTEEVDVEVQAILEKLNRGEELKRSEKIKLQNQKYYLDQDGTFKLYPSSLKVEVGNQYVYDPASGKFIAVSGAVGKAKPGETVDTEEGVEVIGARVVMPEYFAQGERVTKDQLMELMKDPEFLADFQNGRKSIDVFNDLEMQSYLERYAPKEKAPIGPERQIGKQKLLTGRPPVKGLLTDVTVAGAGDTPVRPIKGGPAGKIEITDTGVYFTNVEGKSTQLPVKDKVNPSETLAELGYEAIPQPGVKPLPAPVAVELAPDNVTFTIDGNKVTWLKFNFGNFGELQTADVLTPDGRKIKIKDRDVVYDMAVLLSNNTQTKLAVPPAKLTNDINDAVENVRAGFDVGMKAIDTIFGDVDPIVEEVLSLVEMGAEVEPNEKAAAELWLEDAISRTQKIDTQNEAEKASVLEWASKILSDINQAKVGAERPVQPEPVAQRAGGEPVAKGEPSAPAKQRAYEFPELPSRGKALVKRLAGAKGEAEAERIVTTIKEAYKAEKEPAAELAKIGYGKQEYEKAVSEVVEALKPTVTEVEAEAAVVVFKPERNELIGMIEDGTAKDMIQSGELGPLEFMRMVDKFELPMPKWFEGLEETMAEEMGYRTEEEDAELLDLINKAYERTGIPELKAGELQKWSASDLGDKTPVEVMQALSEMRPELSGLMQEAIDVHNQLQKIKEQGGGYVVKEGFDKEKYQVFPTDLFPFPYRIYSQYYNSTRKNRSELAEKAIEDFKEKLNAAKEYLKNPPSQSELAEMKAKAIEFKESKEAAIKAEQEAARQRIAEKAVKGGEPVDIPALTVGKMRKPLRFQYVRNPKKAPFMREWYGQDVEPAGIYVNQIDNDFVPEGFETGIANLKNPLEIEVNQNNLIDWKNDLSQAYGGKTGQELTEALIGDGFDGIITRYEGGYLGEIIIFSKAAISFEAKEPEAAAGAPQYIEGNPVAGTAEVGDYRPEFMSNIIKMGKPTTIILSNGERIPARYALVKLGDVIPSHDPFAFIKSKGYPVDTQGRTTNDRDYEKDPAAQATTIQYGASPDNAKLLDLSKSPATGPSVITTDGFVVGGNGRVMAMNRMSAANGVRYNTDLAQQAADFGFTAVPTYNAKQPISDLPVVVRIATTEDQYSKANSAKYNAEEGKAKSEADTSLTFGANLSENARAKELVYNEIGKFDTMGEFFADNKASRFVKDLLIKNDLVAEKDINKFFDPTGKWTVTGKELFKQGVFATLFSEDIVRLTDTPGVAAFIDKISKSLPAVAENFKSPDDINLKGEIEDAIKFQMAYHASGIPDVVDFIRQMSLFDKPSLDGALMWSLIENSTAKRNLFRQALDSYNTSLQSEGNASLFEDMVVRSKQDFFELITKNIPENEKQAIKSSLTDEGFGPQGPGTVGEAGERYGKRKGKPGLLQYTGTGRGYAETEVGRSQQGEIDRPALIKFVRDYGVRPDGYVYRDIESGWYDIASGLSMIPGNIVMYREMAKSKSGIRGNKYRFERNGVPFNPYQYLMTGDGAMEPSESYRKQKQIIEAQNAGDVGFREEEKQYRQSQFNFEQNPDAKVVPIKNEAPLMYTSALEIQEKSVEKTGTELTKALTEAKLGRKLEKGEYTVKTSKISIDKNWNIFAPKTKIKSPADVAYIARVLEDYNTEHSMAYFIDENGKSYMLHIASGGITSAASNTAALLDFAMAIKAKSFYFIHNHPSGNMKPSLADSVITGDINKLASALGIEFKGSIIADWDKSQYSFIGPAGGSESVAMSYVYPYTDLATAPVEELSVYHNWVDSLNESISKIKLVDPALTTSYVSSLVAQTKAGEAVKGGVLLLNADLRIIGHLFFNGENDELTIIKGVSLVNAASFITYGTFERPLRPLNTRLNQATYLDHVTVQSNNFGKYDIKSLHDDDLIFPSAANDIPNVQELSMPYGKNDKTEYAVQAAMLNGFVPFEDLMLYMYTEVYNGDAAKLRKNLQDIKAAYDELSLFDDFIESASSIEDVARFDVDKFLISINRPQNKTLSLRQQYNEFASWFENHPELNQYRYYYTVKIDPENNEAYFDVNGVPVKVNGKTLYYSDWVNNSRIQKEWYESQRSKVFDRPPMVWVDKDITPVPYSHVIEGQYAIGEDQALAANLILDRFIPKIGGKKPERGFLLGDGMGIGKTRIELVSANELTRAKKLPVLIITKGDNIVEQFQREAAALSLSNVLFKTEPKDVNEPKIVVGTYEDLTRGKLGNADRYAAVIFDEAHMLKNVGTARSKSAQEFLQKTDHVVFATGTPMDKPIQLAYFISYMSNLPLDEALKPLGVYMSKGKLKRRKDGPKGSLKQLFLNWRTQMIKEGAYIRREYPFYGTMGKVYIRFDPELHVSVLDQIKKTNGRNAVMAANRFQEHLKINYAFDETVKALQEGKQVVIFCMGVNETKIYPDGKKSKDSPYLLVPQFANEFSQKLKAAGIDHAQIFGGDASEKLEESRKFQRGDVKVAVATISSGGTGIDLDDQFGDAPREVIFVTLPWSGNEFDQAQYRVSRRNTKSPSRMRFLFASNSWADMHKEGLVDSKMQTVRLIQAGKDPDMIDIERWREDVDGNIIDIVEDDFNDDLENVSDPQVGQFVNAFPAEPLIEEQQTPSEIKEKFEKGDPATLEAAGALPATSEGEEVIEVTLENQMEPEATGDPTPTTFVEPPAESRKGQATSIGGARKGAPIIKRRSKLMNILFGPPKQKSLSTRVLEIYKRLGIVTTGEHHMKSRLLGFYEHLRKDVKLKVASDIFVALHEAVHFVDFEKLDGVTYKIQNSTDARLKSELEDIHDLFYPGATKSAAEETKIAEGLTMYMQMKLYAPAYVRNFSTVKKEVFSPGGKYYDPIWDKLFNEFEDLKNEIAAMSPLMQAGLRIADMETPKSKEYTLPTWNRFTKTLFKWYDESIPLSLWDDIAGVGFGTAMERTTDQGQTIQSAQNAYFFYRNRNRLASNWISRDPSLITFTAPSRPMYYDTNGQWEMSDYSMEDIIGELKKLEKNKPDMLLDEIWQGVKVRPDEALEISEAYSKYLMMRRIFMDYRKREDQELIIQKTIADGMNDYIDLLSTTDAAMHEAKLAEFNRKYVRKVKVAFEKWKKYNEIIGNDGGTYIQLNEDFSPELLAWSNPAFRDLHSRPYDPNLGDITSDANATQVYTTFAKDFERADRIFDYINNRMLHMMVGTGMLSYKNANEYIQDQNQYPGYASFQRYVSNTFFDDPELQSILPPDKVGKIRSTLQRKGGRTDIIDPLLSQAVMIHEVFRKGMKNLMWLRLANFARADVQLARGLIKLPMVAKVQYDKKGKKIGMERVIAGKVDIPGQVMIYSNGIKQAYQIADQSLLNFYLALNGDMPKAVLAIQQSRLYKPFVNAANLFTMMTTQAYWNFAVQNFTVDQGSIGLNSKLGTIPFFTSAKNFLPAFGLSIGNTISTYMQALGIFQKNFPNRKPNPKQLELLIQYMSAGGSTQTYMTQMMLNEDQKLSIQELFDIKPKGLIPQAKKTVKNAPKILTWSFDLLSLPVGLTELMTRFSEYKAAMDAGLGFEARYRHAVEVMPFGKVGAHWAAKVIFPTISYMRSSFVVSAKTMEEAKDQPGKFATVWASVATAAALGLINLWEEMTDAEKTVYMQADGPTLAQYFIVPARFMGGKENTWYYFRIPEYVGAAHAFGVMYGLGLKTNKEVDQVELARAAAANLPGVINPMEWAVGDKTVAKSVGRQALRYTPTLAKPLAGLVSGKKVTTTGTVPITPRELEFYPQEYQYRIGTRGTSSVAIELSDMIGKTTGLSPVQIDYLLGEYFSRTGKSVTDIIDAKELRSIFTKKREDFALRGRWYEDFYNTLSEKRQYVTVADTDRAPRPAEGTKAYSQWEENLEVLINDYTQYEKTGLLLGEMYKIREHAAINDQQVPLYVYDVIDNAMKSFYDKEPFNVRQEKVDAAYEAVSEAADAVGFEDWRFFKWGSLETQIQSASMKRYYNKLYKN